MPYGGRNAEEERATGSPAPPAFCIVDLLLSHRRIIAFHSCSGGIGLAAARAVLDGAGVDYEAAFYASWKPEYIDDMGQGEMSAREWELNEVWWKAHQAAFDVVEG